MKGVNDLLSLSLSIEYFDIFRLLLTVENKNLGERKNIIMD